MGTYDTRGGHPLHDPMADINDGSEAGADLVYGWNGYIGVEYFEVVEPGYFRGSGLQSRWFEQFSFEGGWEL